MENRKYRKIITRLRASYGNVFGIINRNGEICACSDESRIGKTVPDFHIDDDYVQEQGFACCAVTSGSAPQYAVFVQGEEASAKKDAALVQLISPSLKRSFQSFLSTERLPSLYAGRIASARSACKSNIFMVFTSICPVYRFCRNDRKGNTDFDWEYGKSKCPEGSGCILHMSGFMGCL